MRRFLTAPMLLLCMVLTSCVTMKSCIPDPPVPPPDPIPHGSVDIPKQVAAIQDVRKAVEAGAASIKADAAGIKGETAIGRKGYPKIPQWDFIDKRADSMSLVTEAIDTKVKDLNTAGAELTVAEAERKRQEAFMAQYKKLVDDEKAKSAKLAEEVKSWQDGAKKRQTTIWMTVSGFAALGFVIGIFLFIYAKSELGISVAVSSLILACVSYFMAAYALYVAVVGGIILLFVVAYLLYFLFVNKKALKETVTNFESIKRVNWDDPGVKDKVAIAQSVSTKKIVHDIRLEQGLK